MRACMPVADEYWYKAMVLDVIMEGCMVHECGAMININMMAVGSLGGTYTLKYSYMVNFSHIFNILNTSHKQ